MIRGARTTLAHALAVPCPNCGSREGEPCRGTTGWNRTRAHQERHIDACVQGAPASRWAPPEDRVTVNSTRPQGFDPARVAQAQALRAQGLYWREVAARMGISLSYAQELANDPGGIRANERQRRYDRGLARSQAPDTLF